MSKIAFGRGSESERGNFGRPSARYSLVVSHKNEHLYVECLGEFFFK